MPFDQQSVALVCYVVCTKLISRQYIKQGKSDEAAWVEEGDLVEGLALKLCSYEAQTNIQRSTGMLSCGRCTKEIQPG